MSHSGTGVWVFGYGSLVDPSSFSATIGRELQPGVDFFEAEVAGLGRRWNYGVMHASASGPGPSGATIDYTLDFWAGVIPFATGTLPPIPDPRLKPGTVVPAYLQERKKT